MELTWNQRKALRLASLQLRLELLRYKKPLWEYAPQFALIMQEIQVMAQESQFYDAAAKAQVVRSNVLGADV